MELLMELHWAAVSRLGQREKITRVWVQGTHIDGSPLLVTERPFDGFFFHHHTELEVRFLEESEIPDDWFAKDHPDRPFFRRG